MRTGRVKRATVLVGFTVLLMAVLYLIDPISRNDINCGSAVLPRTKKVSTDTRALPEQCEAPIRHHRWLGGAGFALGTLAVLGTGTRCLYTPD